MNAGRTIFSQLMDFLPIHEFRQCVERYDGNYKVKSFSCWDQFLSMAFAQLTYRESLRDIQVKVDRSLYTILQILSVTLFEKTPISEAFSNTDYKDLEERPCNQLFLFN